MAFAKKAADPRNENRSLASVQAYARVAVCWQQGVRMPTSHNNARSTRRRLAGQQRV